MQSLTSAVLLFHFHSKSHVSIRFVEVKFSFIFILRLSITLYKSTGHRKNNMQNVSTLRLF